jgi:TatD DNase family protein
MFDTHAHLNFDLFDENIDGILHEARAGGVEGICVPGTDIYSSKKAIKLADEHEMIYAAVGIHPADISDREDWSADNLIDQLKDLLRTSAKIVAIGEIGLDKYHIFREYGEFRQGLLDRQMELFRRQLVLAVDEDLSVIIHNRQSKKELLKALDENWDEHFRNRMVFHCCEPDEELQAFAMERDIFLGVDGDVTYDASKKEFVRTISLDRLVVETDSPFMTPLPIRSEKKFPNNPAHLPLIVDTVAELHGVEREIIADHALKNALSLFNLPL